MTEQSPKPPRQASGAVALTLSTAAAAALGWVTLLVVARNAGQSAYGAFAVLWGIYYGLAGIFAGLQHEVTRALVEDEGHEGLLGQTRLVWTAAGIGTIMALLTAATFPLWRATVDADVLAVGALALGVVGLTGLVVVLGVLAAAQRWWALAGLLVADALTRLLAVAVLVDVSESSAAYVAAIGGASWVWAPLLVLGSRAQSLRANLGLPLARRRFWTRAVAAMATTGCASLIIAGFPWLMAMTSREPVGAETAGLLAALVFFRSPVLVLVYGLRPVFLREFLARPEKLASRVWRLWMFSALGGGLLSAGAFAIGPGLLRTTFGSGFEITRVQAAGLVVSAVLLTMATLASLAFLTVGAHRHVLEGWVMAIGATLVVLLLPIDEGPRVVWAAIAGPFVAVVWQTPRLAAGHRVDAAHQGRMAS